jgi:hypothetical protein
MNHDEEMDLIRIDIKKSQHRQHFYLDVIQVCQIITLVCIVLYAVYRIA